MMASTTMQLARYIPIDRRHALVRNQPLLDRVEGAALFADISGFTPLTEALARNLGPQRGAEELIKQLNIVYDVLIAEVDRYGGSVIGFCGDAFTCWFDQHHSIPLEARGTAYSQHGAALRASVCALAIQRAMGQFAAVPTPDGGSVTLSVKVAVASGPARRFVIGDPNIRLLDVLAGDTLDRLARAEQQACKGEVVISADTAAQLGSMLQIAEWRSNVNPNQSIAVLNSISATVEPQPWPPLSPDSLAEAQVRPWLHSPIYRRISEGQEMFLAELRPAVALFLRFEGIDYDHDPTAGDKLDALIRWVQRVLHQYEGTLLEIVIGDKGSYLYAAFGAPVANDNDAVHAVAAALDLSAAGQRFDFIKPVQIGINRGTVRTGAYGGTTFRGYGMLGDAVNLAARLMQAAQPGQILASQHIQQITSDHFTWEALTPIKVKGKSDLIAIYQPHNAKPKPKRTNVLMVGREKERDSLRARLQALLNGQSGPVVIEGEPGIGKSRLLSDLIEQAQNAGLQPLQGAGDAIERSTVYYPWRPVFAQLLGLAQPGDHAPAAQSDDHQVRQSYVLAQLAKDPELLRYAPLLNAVLPLDLPDNELTAQMSGQMRADNTQALLARLLQRVADQAPVLLVLEDAHWFDSASWALVQIVVQRVQPLLLVISTRPMGDPLPQDYMQLLAAPNALCLRLEALSHTDTNALVCQRLGAQRLAEAVSTLIQRKAEGNPFFSEELAYALREAELITVVDGECRPAPGVDFATVNMPDTVQGVITGRIDRLPPEQQLALKAASVIGRLFPYIVLHDIHPIEAQRTVLSDTLQTLDRQGLTLLAAPDPDLAYLFKHVITQEVAYNLMLFEQRRAFHQSVAEWYERRYTDDLSPYYAVLAYHWERAEDIPKTITYLDLAGEQAMRVGVYREAIGFFTQALELDQHAQDEHRQARWGRWLSQLGEAYLGVGDIIKGRESCIRALQVLGEPVPTSKVWIVESIIRSTVQQLLHRIRRPKYTLTENNTSSRVYQDLSFLRVTLGQLEYYHNDILLVLYHGLHQINTAEKIGPSLALARACASMALIYGSTPFHGIATYYANTSREMIDLVAANKAKAEVGQICEFLGFFEAGIGLLREARNTFHQGIEMLKQVNHQRLWQEVLIQQAILLGFLGQFDEAQAACQDLIQAMKQYHNDMVLGSVHIVKAEIAIVQMRLKDAQNELRMGEPMIMRLGSLHQIWFYGVLAKLCWLQNNRDQAQEAVDCVTRLTSTKPPMAFWSCGGYTTVADVCLCFWEAEIKEGSQKQHIQGRQALKAVDALWQFAKVFTLGKPQAFLYKGKYLLLSGQRQKALKHWRKSALLAEQQGQIYIQALAHNMIGQHMDAHEPERSFHLKIASDIFRHLGIPGS
ncbi:MAG: adenylate/guanylate cyclase domain-containing protein [Roseiflexaceae bacterium]